MNKKSIAFCLSLLLITSYLESKIIHINDENQYNSEFKNQKQMLIEFSADWCSVCNNIKRPFEEIAAEDEFQHISFAHVDVDKLDNVSKQNGIVGVPTFVYVENGAKKIEEIGVQNMPAFKDHLRGNLRKTFHVAQNNAGGKMITHNAPPMLETREIAIDVDAAAQEPNIFMRILNGIKDFIMLILQKIQEFFTTIVDAIKGFFGV